MSQEGDVGVRVTHRCDWHVHEMLFGVDSWPYGFAERGKTGGGKRHMSKVRATTGGGGGVQ